MNSKENGCEAREELFKLMKTHPDLPVIPLVDSEVVGDETGSWLGSWGSAWLDEYIILSPPNSESIFPPEGAGAVAFKSDDDIFDTLEKWLPKKEFDTLPDDAEACRPIYDNLPWRKAIMVNIAPPD